VSKAGFDPGSLNRIIHSPIRLGIVSTLYTAGKESFVNLKKAVNTTDGNLTTHLKSLIENGIITMKKRFINNKPNTTYKLTATGRKIFQEYVRAMAEMVKEFREIAD